MRKKISLAEPGTGQPVTIWIEKNAVPQLEKLAAQHGVSRSNLARQVVLNFLNASKGETPAAS